MIKRLLPLLLITAVSADDIAPLSDEFENSATLQNWQDIVEVEGWTTPAHEVADIDTSESGRFHIVPAANTWFAHLRGLLFFKEITGDFIATTRVRVLSRHNANDATEVPNQSFSLTGIFIHEPRDIFQAAPDPFTTSAVWPPADYGSDYIPNTENYIFLSYGTAGNPGTRQFEIKRTLNSNSQLYYDSTGISQTETEAWLQLVRVGDTIVCLRKHSLNGDWIVENRYPNNYHSFPDFGDTLQVGITAYTDWPTAEPFNNGGLETSYHFNYAPPSNGNPDLISQVDYFRFQRPNPALTETILQNMAISFLETGGFTGVTASTPILLSDATNSAAAPYLGENANNTYDLTADNDGDSHPNGIEVILGSDDNDPAQIPELSCHTSETEFSFSFPAIDYLGLTLTIESSSDLDDWDPIFTRSGTTGLWSDGPENYTLTPPDTFAHTVMTAPISEAPRYFRLAVY